MNALKKKSGLIFYGVGVAIAVMAIGTILEKIYGSTFTQTYIWHHPLFQVLWIFIGVGLLWSIVQRKMWHRWQVLGVHIAFISIIAGKMVTSYTAESGRITLEDNKPQKHFLIDNKEMRSLPFEVLIQQSQVIYYPGTRAAQDFNCDLCFVVNNRIESTAKLSMSKGTSFKKYHFYLSGYDAKGRVTLLVSFDPWGKIMTYIGYAILLLSLLLYFFDPQGAFQQALKKKLKKKIILLLWLLGGCGLGLMANPNMPRTISAECAKNMGSLLVYHGNRVCPAQTLCRDFTTKLYGAPSYKKLSSEQVFFSMLFYFEDWMKEPVLKIKDQSVRQSLQIEGKYACFADFFTEKGEKKILYSRALQQKNSAYREADEKFNLMWMLASGELLKIFPVKDSLQGVLWLSPCSPLPQNMEKGEQLFIQQYVNYSKHLLEASSYDDFFSWINKTSQYQKRQLQEEYPSLIKVKIERWYNALVARKILLFGSLIISFLYFGYMIFSESCGEPMNAKVCKIGWGWLLLIFFYLLLLFLFRWIVAGTIPLANGFETMLFLALCVAGLSVGLGSRYGSVVPMGMIIVSFSMLVAFLGYSNPSITLLKPSLHSPLLSIHVLCLMVGYALLSVMFVIGIVALLCAILAKIRRRALREDLIERMQQASMVLLVPALFLLATGIVVGSVWANVSWGRYWAWDPKEVWALITFLVYISVLHKFANFERGKSVLCFHACIVVAFFSVLITYFGVNFWLGGLHSYAN